MLNGRVACRMADALAVIVCGRIERIADALIHRHVTHGPEEPEPVLPDRTTHVEVVILHVVYEIAELEALGAQFVIQIVRLPAWCSATEEEATLDGVAAVF